MSWLWSRAISAAPCLKGRGVGKALAQLPRWSILRVSWLNSVKLVMKSKKKQKQKQKKNSLAWIFLPKAIIWRLISQEGKYEFFFFYFFFFCPLERCVYLLDTKPRSHSNHNRS